MKADQLPSGKWRCRVYLGDEVSYLPDGTKKIKKKFKTFISEGKTQKDKKKVIAEASAFAVERKQANTVGITFGDALDKYIASREATRSARTIDEYRRIRTREMPELMKTRLDKVTQELIQSVVDRAYSNHSSKTVRNWHGLIAAVLKEYRPELRLTTNLPEKTRPDKYIPSTEDIKTVLALVQNTDLEIPVMLAAFGPMRRGEISALRMENIAGSRVHVCENMIKKQGEGWIIKTPKTLAGTRYIDFPDFVSEKWKDKTSGHITDLNPDQLTHYFGRLLVANDIVDENGSPKFSMHSLRHFGASYLHSLGIPNQYIMARGGWDNEAVLNQVYRHVLEQEEKQNMDKANEAMTAVFSSQKVATE